jgi:hypothetical protein
MSTANKKMYFFLQLVILFRLAKIKLPVEEMFCLSEFTYEKNGSIYSVPTISPRIDPGYIRLPQTQK